MKNIAIFASGSGSNAQKIIEHFRQKPVAKVELVLSNKKDAFVLERVQQFNIPTITFNRDEFYHSEVVLDLLIQHNIDLVVLAGFLWFIPESMTTKYANRIVNIHPALLPKYGGKGMYGMRVHEAIVENREMFSGITIHYVNDRYDEGDIIFQAQCKIESNDTAEVVANRVHALEYKYYPTIIEQLVNKL